MNFKDVKKKLSKSVKGYLIYKQLGIIFIIPAILMSLVSAIISLVSKDMKPILLSSLISVFLFLVGIIVFFKVKKRKNDFISMMGEKDQFGTEEKMYLLSTFGAYYKLRKPDLEAYLFLSKKNQFDYIFPKPEKEVNITKYNKFLYEYFINANDPYVVIKLDLNVDYSKLKSEFLKIEKINDFENKIIFSKHNLVYYLFIEGLINQDNIQSIKTNDKILKKIILMKTRKFKNIELEDTLEGQTK